MTRRALLAVLPALILTHRTSAEISIDRRHTMADARCQDMATSLERHGLTDRERAHLTARECREVRGRWVSARAWGA